MLGHQLAGVPAAHARLAIGPVEVVVVPLLVRGLGVAVGVGDVGRPAGFARIGLGGRYKQRRGLGFTHKVAQDQRAVAVGPAPQRVDRALVAIATIGVAVATKPDELVLGVDLAHGHFSIPGADGLAQADRELVGKGHLELIADEPDFPTRRRVLLALVHGMVGHGAAVAAAPAAVDHRGAVAKQVIRRTKPRGDGALVRLARVAVADVVVDVDATLGQALCIGLACRRHDAGHGAAVQRVQCGHAVGRGGVVVVEHVALKVPAHTQVQLDLPGQGPVVLQVDAELRVAVGRGGRRNGLVDLALVAVEAAAGDVGAGAQTGTEVRQAGGGVEQCFHDVHAARSA